MFLKTDYSLVKNFFCDSEVFVHLACQDRCDYVKHLCTLEKNFSVSHSI